MRHSKKTREQWFGSYFFSWFMEYIMIELSQKLGDEIFFLTPHLMDRPNISYGGKYPDRFVLQAKKSVENMYAEMDTICSKTRQFFSKFIYGISDKKINVEIDAIDQFLASFLQIRFFCMTIDDFFKVKQPQICPKCQASNEHLKSIAADCNSKEIAVNWQCTQCNAIHAGASPVDIAYTILDSLESSFMFSPGKSDQTCDVCKLHPACAIAKEERLCPICFMKRFAHQSEYLRNRVYFEKEFRVFPSIQEISIHSLEKEYPDIIKACTQRDKHNDQEINLEALQKKLGNVFQTYHKYFAIILADGDNLGQLASVPGNDAHELSRRLFEFAERTEVLIRDYGGYPIFLGGDDILAFMPVCYQDQTVMDFVKHVSGEYMNIVDCNIKKNKHILWGKYCLLQISFGQSP
jgi:hypothetical protein